MEIAGSVLIRRGWETGGFALASVILAMALLMAFVLTALTAGRGQVVVGGQSLDWIQARLSAESAVHRFIEETRGLSPLAPGATLPAFRSGLSGNRPWTVSLFRTGLEHHAVIARSRLRGGEPTTAAARLVWWLSPGARVSTFKASLEVGDLAGSDIPPTGVMAVADALALVGPHGSCRGSPDLDSEAMALGGLGPLPGAPEWGDVHSWGSAQAIRLGLLTAPRLFEGADVFLSDAAVSSGCPTCWSGLTLAEAGTQLSGSGAGLLISMGDLRLAHGARWDGLVLVGGNLEMASASMITGLVRVGGRAVLSDDASVVASACAAYRSLVHAPGIQRPLSVGPPSWIGPISPG